jgi:hypothetical protein
MEFSGAVVMFFFLRYVLKKGLFCDVFTDSLLFCCVRYSTPVAPVPMRNAGDWMIRAKRWVLFYF